jgi:hypothetical protein
MAPTASLDAPLLRFALATFGLTLALLGAGLPDAGASGLLVNGGFEQGTEGWSANAGQIEAVASPVQEGTLAGRFTGSGQPTTQYVYQWVAVQPDEDYEASGWIAATGARVSRVFLRISWHDSGGQLLLHSDSSWLPRIDGSFYHLSTGVGLSLSAARSARVTAVVQADSAFTVHLDGFEFRGPPAIPSTPAPQPATAPPTTPGAPPTSQPSTPTVGTTPRSTPTRTPAKLPGQSPGPGETPETAEPLVFPQLVNGGFEDLRDDGTPYGWRKQGGLLGSAAGPRTEGQRSLVLSSATGSTKWAYQTVEVAGGAYYQATADAQGDAGLEAAFLRISWYASRDGSGPAISSLDSLDEVTGGTAGFQRLSTAPVQAPAGAGSAKVRLMLRPVSEQPASGHFDRATFALAQPGDSATVLGAVRERVGAGATFAHRAPESGEGTPSAERAPVILANVRPPSEPSAEHPAVRSGGQDYWAVALAVGIAAAAVGLAGAYEIWQRRRSTTDLSDN